MIAATATAGASTPATPGSPARPPACWPRSTRPACSTPPTCTSPPGSARLGGERDERVLLAAGAGRARACGSARCASTWPRSADTVLGEADELVDVSALPWPEPAAWLAACRASPLVAVGADAAGGRPLRLVDGLLYLDRYWRRRSWSAASWPSAPRAPPPAVDLRRLRGRAGPAVRRRPQAATGSGWPPRSARCAGSRCSPAGRAPARPPPSPGCWRCCTTSPARRRGSRWPRRPARPRPGCRRRSTARAAGRGCGARVPPASTLHRLLGWRPGSRAGSATTAPPAAVRRRRGRRDVDGVADDDGPAAGGGPPAGPAGPGRRPRPARLGRGRRGARRPGPRRRAAPSPRWRRRRCADAAASPGRAGASTAWSRSTTCWRFGGAIADLARAVRAGDADTAVDAAARRPTPTWSSSTPGRRDPTAGVRARRRRRRARRCAAAAAAGRRRAPRWPRLERAPAAVRAPPRPVRRGPVDRRDRALAGRRRPAATRRRRGTPAGRCWSPPTTTTPACSTATPAWWSSAPDGPAGGLRPRRRRPTLLPPSRLADVDTVHAMTVHRGQGSQFGRVTVVLPPAESPLLTRELLYTAVTRAREHVRVVGIGGGGAGRGAAAGRPGQRAAAPAGG